jgi:2-polyprenyl-6-methoxyphenol hydroxylase-like FAD-dependent oxidoreductase
MKNILISGAGIAGLTLAFWLKQYGFNPTLIEKHPSLKLMRPFANKNQALANMSANIMKDSSYSVWLHRIASLMPAKVLHYFKNLALKRTTKAANAINLKDYNEKNR